MMGDDRSGSVSPSPPCLQLPGDREEDKQRDVRELILRISKVGGQVIMLQVSCVTVTSSSAS